MKNKIILCIVCMVLLPCSLFSEQYFITGGDIRKKGSIKNNTVTNVDESDTVIFYKVKSSDRYFYATTNAVIMDPEKKDQSCLGDSWKFPTSNYLYANHPDNAFIKKRLLAQQEWEDYCNSEIRTLSALLRDKEEPTLYVYKSVSKFDVDEYNNTGFSRLDMDVRFENIGKFQVTEIVYVDALPKKYQPEHVELFKSGLIGSGGICDSDFKDITWETRNNNDLSFLIVRINFNKPLKGFISNRILMIKIKGTYHK